MAAVVLHAFLPEMPEFYTVLNTCGKAVLKVAIFLIGTQLTREMLKNVGMRAMMLGLILWFSMAVGVLAWVKTI